MSSVEDAGEEYSLADERDIADSLPESSEHGTDEDFDVDDERPGRFHGPDSSWRDYTRDERALAASLDQAEANDLSIHLFNTHAWKARLYNAQTVDQVKAWENKRQWIREDAHGAMPYLPHAGWTAWPLRPFDVPRSRETWGVPTVQPADDPGMLKKTVPWRPGMELQEELTALSLRLAKDRFRRTHEQFIKKRPSSKTAPSESSRASLRQTSRSDDMVEHPEGDSESESQVQPEGVSGDEHLELTSVPAFMADDDTSGSILRPTIAHVIRHLDDLLLSLHKSRSGHKQDYTDGRSSRSQSRSAAHSPEASPERVPSKRKHRASLENVDDVHGLADSASKAEKMNQGPRNNRASTGQRKALGSRDWSEILCVANLTAWDRKVIDRTAKRCANLFSEGVSLHFPPENSVTVSLGEVVRYVPGMPLGLPSDHGDNSMAVIKGETGRTAYFCPHKACPRHRKPYKLHWRLTEHVGRYHGHSEVNVDDFEEQTVESSEEEVVKQEVSDPEVDELIRIRPYNPKALMQHSNYASRNDFLQPITFDVPERPRKRRPKRKKAKASSPTYDR